MRRDKSLAALRTAWAGAGEDRPWSSTSLLQGIWQGIFSDSAQRRRFRTELMPNFQRLVANSLPLPGREFFRRAQGIFSLGQGNFFGGAVNLEHFSMRMTLTLLSSPGHSAVIARLDRAIQ
jgi:hypothetical protein